MNKFFKHCKKVDIYIGLVVVAITFFVMVLTGDVDFDSDYFDFWVEVPLALALGVTFAIALEFIFYAFEAALKPIVFQGHVKSAGLSIHTKSLSRNALMKEMLND